MRTLFPPTPPSSEAPASAPVNPRAALHAALLLHPPLLREELLILNAELTEFIDNHPHTNGTCLIHFDNPYTASLVKELTRTTVDGNAAWLAITHSREAVTLQAGAWWAPPQY